MTTDLELRRDQIAQEAAEHIAEHLNKVADEAGWAPVPGKKKPPTTVPEIKQSLLDGEIWRFWLDARVIAAWRELHGEGHQPGPSDGYTTIHAKVRFIQDLTVTTAHGTTETFTADEVLDPVQLHHESPTTDPTSPDVLWRFELPGPCFNFAAIPGRSVEVLSSWPV